MESKIKIQYWLISMMDENNEKNDIIEIKSYLKDNYII